MTAELALEYISRRTKELGWQDYSFRLRHMILKPHEKLEIEAWQEIFMLVQEACDVRIDSDFGVFDLSADNNSEMQYEHQGLIIIENYSDASTVHVRFIQVIPKQQSNGRISDTEIRETKG